MPFKIGVSSGLYTIARADELASAIRKVGFGLTRGVSAIEVAADVPHEITETDGAEIRYIADKQGVEILFHGSLTLDFAMPERAEWRDAHNHAQKSVTSAVYAGCKYVNFHACLNIWLELMTYAGRKLTMVFCDHEGRFISHILQENERLRNWFVRERWHDYLRDILTSEEAQKVSSRVDFESRAIERQIDEIGNRARRVVDPVTRETVKEAEISPEEAERMIDDIKEKQSTVLARKRDEFMRDAIRDKLAKGGRWDSEELRGVVGIIDGYHMMAHYLFFNKDPIWMNMAGVYSGALERYKVNYNDDSWLTRAWRSAEEKNDREFKEFFYAVVAAKFLEGHMKKLLEWMNNELIPKQLKGSPGLQRVARELKIVIENPDARDPGHAGLHLISFPRQVYVAVKTMQQTLKTDRVWMLMDFEHTASQGIDPVKDMDSIAGTIPDFGSYVMAVHSNAPNPLHAHQPLEFGDLRVYKMLYNMKKTGMGKNNTVYVIYERGGGEDPIKQSIDALKLMIHFVEKETPPEELPLKFYGLEDTGGDIRRQVQIIRDHAWEPLKDLLQMPEEEWGVLSSEAVKKGKREEVWKKAQLR